MAFGAGRMGVNRMMNINMSPWDSPNAGGNFGGGNMRQGGGGNMRQGGGGNMRQGGGGNMRQCGGGNMRQGGGGQGMNAPMINRGGPGNHPYNRGIQVGFQNRGAAGAKSAPKQGAGDIRSKQNAFDRTKKRVTTNANNKNDSATGDKNNGSKESPYATVPNHMFYCHLCKKHIVNANSFENHLKGRAHLMLRELLEERYRLKTNMIRHELKIAEQLKSIELGRLERKGKTQQRPLGYCNMCDLHFHGHMLLHRKSEGHLQLKNFLHPKCIECNKQYASRIDYVTRHLLSADHLQKAAEKNTKVGESKRTTLTILTEEEELKGILAPQCWRKKPIPQKPAEGAEVKKEGEDAEAKKENEEAADETKEGEELNETEEEGEIALPVDPDDCILDYSDGDVIPTEVDNRLPKYNSKRPVGTGLITKLECFECSLCGKFLDTDKTVEVHSRTVTHHRNFLKFINEKSNDTKIAQKRAAAALEESAREKRKLEKVEAAAASETAVKIENADAEAGEGELYDPSESTGHDGEEGDFKKVDNQGDHVHSRTVTHHRNFLKCINKKSSDTKIAQKRAAAALEESERKKLKLEEVEAAAAVETTVKVENIDAEGGEGELYDPSEGTGDDGEKGDFGNFLKLINEKSSDTKIAQKRSAAALEESEREKCKLEKVEAAAASETAVKVENIDAEGGEEELYDPSEGTGDDGEKGDFGNFLKCINEKSSDTKIAQKRAAAALEESERKPHKLEEVEAAAASETAVKVENIDAEGGEGELYDPSEGTGDDGEKGDFGNFLKCINEKSSDTKIAQKRAAAALKESERKTHKLEEVEAAAAGETAVKVENIDTEGDEGELYDPSEGTGHDGEEGDFEKVDNQGDQGKDGEGEEGGDDEDMEAQDDGEQDGDKDQDQETEPKPVKEQAKPEPVKTPAKSDQNTPA